AHGVPFPVPERFRMFMRSARFIILDDDEDVRTLLQLLLKRSFPFAQIVGCTSAVQLFRELKAHGADLLVTDCFMRETDGAAVVARLRAGGFSLPVIMISGSDEGREAGEAAGVDEFVEKRYAATELPALIHSILEAAHPR